MTGEPEARRRRTALRLVNHCRAIAGLGLLAVLTLSLRLLHGSGVLPWTASTAAARIVGSLSMALVLIGGLAVGLVLVAIVRVIVARWGHDPDPPPAMPGPTPLPWWPQAVWTVSALGLLAAPFVLFGLFRTPGIPASASPAPTATSGSAQPNVSATPAPGVRPGATADPTLWPVLLMLGLVGLAMLSTAVVLRLGASRRKRLASRRSRIHIVARPGHELTPPIGEIPADPRAAVVACYLRFEAALARRGVVRAPFETPTDLLHRAELDGLPVTAAARDLCALYDQARFSDGPLPPSRRSAVLQALAQAEAAVGSSS